MANRKLLIVSYHFPPSAASGAFRMLGFARHLPKAGWDVVVVAPPSLPWEPVDPGLGAKVPGATAVYPAPYRRGLAQRVAPHSCWLPRALAACRRAIDEHRVDAILTSGPPHQVHLIGLALKRGRSLTWAADFRDPWINDGKPVAARGFRTRCAERAEAAVFRWADVVIANAPRARQVFREAYPAHQEKVVAVPNGYDPETFAVAAVVGPVERSATGAITVVHAGATYAGRDPRPFLDAIGALAADPGRLPRPLRVRFIGPPPEASYDLVAEARRRGLGNVVAFTGQVPYAEALREMAASDLLLLMDSPGRLVGVPAKLYEYLGAGRPILALGERDGDLAWVLSESGAAHRLASPTDPAEIASALSELAAETAPGARADGPGGALKFTRESLARRLAEVLDSAASRAAEPRAARRDRPASFAEGAFPTPDYP